MGVISTKPGLTLGAYLYLPYFLQIPDVATFLSPSKACSQTNPLPSSSETVKHGFSSQLPTSPTPNIFLEHPFLLAQATEKEEMCAHPALQLSMP